MLHNERTALGWIGLSEGGFVNHPKDPGGATDRGITQRTYDAWNKLHGKPLRSVKGISKEEAERILVSQYFNPVAFDRLPDGLDYAVADYSVNSGPVQAVKDLQRALGFKGSAVDGIIGNQTLARIQSQSGSPDAVAALIRDLCNRRMNFLRGLKTWNTFGTGWKARVMGEHEGYQRGDRGVIDRAIDMALGLAWNNAQREIVRPVGPAKALPPGPPAGLLDDPAGAGSIASVAGSLTALGGVMGSIGGLHPAVQAIAVVGLLVAVAGVAYVILSRRRAIARGEA